MLCFLSDNPVRFARLLAVFLAIDVVTWRYLVVRVIRPSVKQSKGDYFQNDPGNYSPLIKLDLLHRAYKDGHWQRWRFGTAAAGVLILNGLVMSPASDHVIARAILGYVVLIEVWVWLYRLRTDIQGKFVDYLARHYSLVPLQP